jgi:hypothetical protein
MASFNTECVVGEDRVYIEVPVNCSAGDAMKKASEVTGRKGVSIWCSDVRLVCDQMFADYFEPEAIYVIKLGDDFPEGSLMLSSSEKLGGFGIDLTNAKLLMDVKAGPFDMEEFVAKVVEREMNPTLLLLEWKPDFVVGGLAAVPWPKDVGWFPSCVPDFEKKSFIFSVEPNVQRYGLVGDRSALMRGTRGNGLWGFAFGCDLGVVGDGMCWANSYAYAGTRDEGRFPPLNAVPFIGFEVWSL